ncbi:hypothetical protein FRX31_027105, partial [Thalictrum thalictroides]
VLRLDNVRFNLSRFRLRQLVSGSGGVLEVMAISDDGNRSHDGNNGNFVTQEDLDRRLVDLEAKIEAQLTSLRNLIFGDQKRKKTRELPQDVVALHGTTHSATSHNQIPQHNNINTCT